jgi:rhamnogalacturonyl hydrolase YesR
MVPPFRRLKECSGESLHRSRGSLGGFAGKTGCIRSSLVNDEIRRLNSPGGECDMTVKEDIASVEDILWNVLASAKAKHYSGYSKFDALNSPVLSALSLDSKWLRILFTQAVKMCPLNIRPLLGVRTSRNPKGVALFAQAYLSLYEATQDREALEEARALLQWLVTNPSPAEHDLCWGYNYVWQNTIFLQKRWEPNLVVTVFGGEALLRMYRVTGEREYLDYARSVARFIRTRIPVLYEDERVMAIAYVPGKVDAVVINNCALAGGFLIKLWKDTGEESYSETARKLLNYTVRCRTPYHAWYYTEPREKSPIAHDNYHTGGILDALLEYFEETGDPVYSDIYWNALEYYSAALFESDGAPLWMNNRRYPHDIHGAAQGIITFAKASQHRADFLRRAEAVLAWTQKNLYRPETGDYMYRKGRFIRWNYSLMHWCNGWMARALGEMLGAGGRKP